MPGDSGVTEEGLRRFLRIVQQLQETYPPPEGPRRTRSRRRRQWRQRRAQRLQLQQRIFEAVLGSSTTPVEQALAALQISD
uniref:Protein Rev n=1 Tax=Simian immunodeficiency virus TaxID=11723 RepID=A0A1P8NRQ9_SIV|nr:rev protein [Simian immunodeficiency virus]